MEAHARAQSSDCFHLQGNDVGLNGNPVFGHERPYTYAEAASLWEFVATFVVTRAAAF